MIRTAWIRTRNKLVEISTLLPLHLHNQDNQLTIFISQTNTLHFRSVPARALAIKSSLRLKQIIDNLMRPMAVTSVLPLYLQRFTNSKCYL